MFRTEQEDFWAGDFGTDYSDRNCGGELLASNLNLFTQIIRRTQDWNSIIEFGANVGMNLEAISLLKPNLLDISAVEINRKAVETLKSKEFVDEVFDVSILDFTPDKPREFVLIKGVLIHIAPDELENVYEKLYTTSSKYICIAEYYNPTPLEVTYRGHGGKLFKRDFAGEFMDKYPSVTLEDYGFVYRRDLNFKQDDITWFLLKK